MKKITNAQELHEAIDELELKKLRQVATLEEHVAEIFENLKPANIIKNTLQNVFSSKESKSNLIGSVVGLGTGFLSKKLLVGKSVNVFRKLLGAAVEFGIAGLIAKNAGKVKEKGSELISKIFRKKNRDYHDYEEVNE